MVLGLLTGLSEAFRNTLKSETFLNLPQAFTEVILVL